jgi:nuclear receptor subfamily 2 group C
MIQSKANKLQSQSQGSLHDSESDYSDDEEQSKFMYGVLMHEKNVPFKIQLPNLLPNMHYVCEIGSRLLFKSIDWLKDIQLFSKFHVDNQVALLTANWIEVFIIGLAQVIISSTSSLKNMIMLSLVNFLKTLIVQQNGGPTAGNPGNQKNPKTANKIKKMLNNLLFMNNFIDSAVNLQLDDVEFAHLKLICLFNPNKYYPAVSSEKQIKKSKLEKIQLQIRQNLKNYLQSKTNDITHERFTQILSQTMPVLSALDKKMIEYLFFNNLVGYIKIETVIPYILNLNYSNLGEFERNNESGQNENCEEK